MTTHTALKFGLDDMRDLKVFEASDYLNTEDDIVDFLRMSLENPNPDVFLRALQEVAKARGMSQLASDAGMNRETLDQALAPGARPQYGTVLKLINALGVKLPAGQLEGRI